MISRILLALSLIGFAACARAADPPVAPALEPIYCYQLVHEGQAASYDEAIAVSTLQGIVNRETPRLYVLSGKNAHPRYWLDLLSKDHRWLADRDRKTLPDLDAVFELARPLVKGVIIWDPALPATVNIATTAAGVEDAVVLSPEFADRYNARWKLPVLHDFRGQFKTKNDAYRWAIKQYLESAKCSSRLLCLFEDAFTTRPRGDITYVITRDWAVKNRAFVFDLSPWADEVPGDDPSQKPGDDLDTYRAILTQTQRNASGEHMTELTGFFAFSKYSRTPDHQSQHEGVSTEWESVWLMSPFGVYQNTISGGCFNQSFHSHAPRKPLKQKSLPPTTLPADDPSTIHVCFFMSDYDSATPLYAFLPEHWSSPARGSLPLAWGINPNLLDCYPDLIAYFYETATPNDTFTSDATAAGYTNASRIAEENLPLFVRHNLAYFREADLTIAPMLLDRVPPSASVKDAYRQFAPEGLAVIIADVLGKRGEYPAPQVWPPGDPSGMPIVELYNDTCNSKDPKTFAKQMSSAIKLSSPNRFYFFRTCWINPETVQAGLEQLHTDRPELNLDVVDPHTFFALFKASQR